MQSLIYIDDLRRDFYPRYRTWAYLRGALSHGLAQRGIIQQHGQFLAKNVGVAVRNGINRFTILYQKAQTAHFRGNHCVRKPWPPMRHMAKRLRNGKAM